MYNDEPNIHPAETAMFVAAALRGLHLHTMPGGFYAVYKFDHDNVVPVAAWKRPKEVCNLLGASGRVTLRQAAERDGLKWPDSPDAFLDTMAKLSPRPSSDNT